MTDQELYEHRAALFAAGRVTAEAATIDELAKCADHCLRLVDAICGELYPRSAPIAERAIDDLVLRLRGIERDLSAIRARCRALMLPPLGLGS